MVKSPKSPKSPSGSKKILKKPIENAVGTVGTTVGTTVSTVDFEGYNQEIENPIWGKWVKNGSTHLVVYLGGTGSVPSGHPVTDKAMENAVGKPADFLFLGKVQDKEDEDAFDRTCDLYGGTTWLTDDYKTATWVGFSKGAAGLGCCVEETRMSECDTGFEPRLTRSIEVGDGDVFSLGDADIRIKSTGDRHCPHRNMDDATLLMLGEITVTSKIFNHTEKSPVKVVTHMDQMKEPADYLLVQPGRKEILEKGEYSKLTYPHATIGSEIINSSLLYNI